MTETTTRPPTPVGWSDTDWIKHLRDQEYPHPLAGLHINQGSMDAAADAYEAECYASELGHPTQASSGTFCDKPEVSKAATR